MTHHLGDLKTEARTAIVTGDPDRVSALAAALGATGTPWARRGFVCVEAVRQGEPILVASTGIGGPSTAIVVEELWQLSISQIIRVGTCGSLQRRVRPGDIVVSCGSVRDDGTSLQYLPVSVPAVPDPVLLGAILVAARSAGVKHHVGLTHCKDAYYAERPDGLPLAEEWRAKWAMLRSIGVLATEMEASTLFAVATVRRFQAAALFVSVDDTISPGYALESLRDATRVAAAGAVSARAAMAELEPGDV